MSRVKAVREGEGGYVLVLTAMLLIPMLLISAMAVDYGAWYTEGSRMQRAADAAALAGVVWLPNLTTATTVADNTARADGYDNTLSNISVVVTQLSDYELKVVITDDAGKVYLSSFVNKSVTISRAATAKYVLPVPLGSPHNYFGTDDMVSGSPEGFYAAINGTCQSKYQGDPFAVPYTSNNANQTNACTAQAGYTDNPDYITPTANGPDGNQYLYYITLPANRTQNLYIDLWNPAADETQTTSNTTSSTTTITTTGATQPTDSCSNFGSSYTCTTTISLSAKASSTPSLSCNGSAPYTCTSTFVNGSTTTFTTTSTSSAPSQGSCTNSGSGSNKTYTCSLTITTTVNASATPSFSCSSGSGMYTCALSSSYTTSSTTTINDPGGNSGVPTTTFSLYTPDNTPLDDSDNPLADYPNECASGDANYPNPHTYSTGYDGSTRTILGQAGWSDFCIIPASAPAGKYILGVRNSSTDSASGINDYAIMASYADNIGATCDFRTDTTCPEVAGKNWISIYANSSSSTADFYLAEIDPEYAGKTVDITLFDPGEGGNYIQILDPSGTAQSFVATDMGMNDNTPGTPSSPETELDVTNAKYNGRYVQLAINLPSTYGTGLSQYWWQVKYVFGSGAVTDRTTWGVQVLGNPVHLTS